MSKYSHNSLLVRGAIKRIGIIVTDNDVRRLIPLMKDCVSEAEVAKQIRLLVSKYKTNPAALLEVKGIGKKTFLTIINLVKEVEGKEAIDDTNANSNIDAALVSIRLVKRRTGNLFSAKLDRVTELLGQIQVELINKTLNTK